MNNVEIIVDRSLENKGFLKSIPFMKEKFGIKNFTFFRSKYIYEKNNMNPMFNLDEFSINYILLTPLNMNNQLNKIDHICQIITQKQFSKIDFDITKEILEYCLKHPDFKYFIITDTGNLKLKESGNIDRPDRSIVDNYRLKSPRQYDSLIKNYCLKKYSEFDTECLLQTKNLYFIDCLINFQNIFYQIDNITEIFNFRKIMNHSKNFAEYKLLKILEILLEDINSNKSDDLEITEYYYKNLSPFIDFQYNRTKTYIQEFFYSIRFNVSNFRKILRTR